MPLTSAQRELCERLGLPEELVVEITTIPVDYALYLGEGAFPKKDDKKSDKQDKKSEKQDKKDPVEDEADEKGDPKKGSPGKNAKPGEKPKGPVAPGKPTVPSFAAFGASAVDPTKETPEEKEAKKNAKYQSDATKAVAQDLRKRLNTKPDTVTFYPSTERA